MCANIGKQHLDQLEEWIPHHSVAQKQVAHALLQGPSWDVVMLKQGQPSLNYWTMGLVIPSIYSSADRKVCNVDIRVRVNQETKQTFLRPISSVVLLLPEESN